MSYNVFFDEKELPKGAVITVVKPYGEKLDGFPQEDMLVGEYKNGQFCDEPNLLTATDVTTKITDYVDEKNGNVYVHMDVTCAYDHAKMYSEIYDECGGNLDIIADRIAEKMCPCLLEEAEEEE